MVDRQPLASWNEGAVKAVFDPALTAGSGIRARMEGW